MRLVWVCWVYTSDRVVDRRSHKENGHQCEYICAGHWTYLFWKLELDKKRLILYHIEPPAVQGINEGIHKVENEKKRDSEEWNI